MTEEPKPVKKKTVHYTIKRGKPNPFDDDEPEPNPEPYQIVNFLGHHIDDFTIQQIEFLITLLQHTLKKRGVEQ